MLRELVVVPLVFFSYMTVLSILSRELDSSDTKVNWPFFSQLNGSAQQQVGEWQDFVTPYRQRKCDCEFLKL